MIVNLPEEIFLNILEYTDLLDIKTISRLSLTCKRLNEICKSNIVLLPYYNSLFETKYVLTEKSVHIGPQTYLRCKIGEYPGWNKVNDHIHTEICLKTEHYSDTCVKIKKIGGNLFQKCAVRKYNMEKKKLRKWTVAREHKLILLQEQITQLNEIKNSPTVLIDRYKPHLK